MKHILKLLLPLLFLLPLTANAMPTTPIKFSKGSYCGSFTGDLSKGRIFTIDLDANQEFIVYSATLDGDGVEFVIDSKGVYLEDQSTADNYFFLTKNKGLHTIQMIGRGFTEVKFCAY